MKRLLIATIVTLVCTLPAFAGSRYQQDAYAWQQFWNEEQEQREIQDQIDAYNQALQDRLDEINASIQQLQQLEDSGY